MPKEFNGALWDFSTSILSQNTTKKLMGDPLAENSFLMKKVAQCRKNLKGDALGFFYICSVAKHDEKIDEGTLWRKSSFL